MKQPPSKAKFALQRTLEVPKLLRRLIEEEKLVANAAHVTLAPGQ